MLRKVLGTLHTWVKRVLGGDKLGSRRREGTKGQYTKGYPTGRRTLFVAVLLFSLLEQGWSRGGCIGTGGASQRRSKTAEVRWGYVAT